MFFDSIEIDSLNEYNIDELSFSQLYIAARIISRKMSELHEKMSDSKHSLLFSMLDFELLNMSVDITDSGDVLYIRSLYYSMLDIANMNDEE